MSEPNPQRPPLDPAVIQMLGGVTGQVLRRLFDLGDGDISAGADRARVSFEQADKINAAILRELRALNANMTALRVVIAGTDKEDGLLDVIVAVADEIDVFGRAFDAWFAETDKSVDEFMGVYAAFRAEAKKREIEEVEPEEYEPPER